MEAGSTETMVTGKVLGLLTDETNSFRGVLDPVFVERILEHELEMIQLLIKDIGNLKHNCSNPAAEVDQRLDIIIDTYLLGNVQLRNRLIKLKSGRSVASEIQYIIETLQWFKLNREMISSRPLQQASTYVDWTTYGPILFDESEVVGIDSEKERLLSVLVGEPSTRLVISLVGIGGIGKTTLASSVYRNEEIRRHFDFLAWVIVSESYNLEELLRALTTQICLAAGDTIGEEIRSMQLQELSSHLNQYFLMKRYLIVFDDVWKTEFWEIMNPVFPNTSNGSRIIITTRSYEIAYFCDMVQNLQPLSEEKALELFCKRKSWCEPEGNCPPELEELSLEFVRRCHGLPLVITFMADFLSTKEKDDSEWRYILHQLNDEFDKMPFFGRVELVMFSRSYDDLPVHIRPCLLYFGIFPKDFVVPDLKLFRLWIAEGLIKEEASKTLEEVAVNYLNELINRNLVQVSHYINNYGTVRMCRVHALVHYIILSRAEGIGICQTLYEKSSRREGHRLSICGHTKDVVKLIQNSNVRSVFLCNFNEPISPTFLVNLFERFKLLELLDFENVPLDYLPKEVGNLSLLKYLSLRNTKVKKLPESVGLLFKLQTLDVRNTLMHELPIQILKLKELQHLLASVHNDNNSLGSTHGVRIKKGIGRLRNLQTLLTIEAHSSGLGVIQDLGKLRQLRWLSISKLTAVTLKAFCTSIKKMNHLESLSLYSANNHEVFDLEAISSPPPSLRRLFLKCQLEKLPDWILTLQNLCVLCLSFSRLTVDPLKALYCLPNLESLWLHEAYIGEQLHFEEGCFQKLKQLVLTKLYDLRMMRIEEGALPLLEELRIGQSPDELSSDIKNLRNLQVLEYYDMPYEFVLRLQPEGGSDYWKVEHLPSVRFWFRVKGRRYMLYKLGEPELLDHLQCLASNIDDVAHREVQSSFYYSDDDDDDDDDDSTPTWNGINRLSLSSNCPSFFSDDIVD